MNCSRNGRLMNRKLFKGRGTNILPQKCNKQRQIFMEKCIQNRLAFNKDQKSKILCDTYENEKRTPRMNICTFLLCL